MFKLAVIFSIVAVSSAIVCTPELCQNVKQEPLNCQGSIIPNGGFCGCTDSCAKVEGELCQATFLFGILPAGSCDKGLTCKQQEHMALGRGTCVKVEPTKDISTRMLSSTSHHTTCEQQRMARLISMVVWQGMWIPKCDPIDGTFMPEQCDNTHQCFCVDKVTGTVDESTKMLGHVDCSASTMSSDEEVAVVEREVQTAVETTTRAQTKCEQIRAIRQISFVIWKGMWTPNCDAEGKFLPEQCDNTQHCFCVDAVTGEVDQSTKMLGHVDCSATTSNDAKIAVKSKRSATLCRKMKSERMTSPTIWKGMWFPNCDENGQFLPEQCDIDHNCFCVDTETGVVDESTKMFGSVNCLPPATEASKDVEVSKRETGVETSTRGYTLCEQMRAVRMTSFVIWQGMWTPKCDSLGRFLPEQCDNTQHCFCVSPDKGEVDESTKVLGSADCTSHY